MVQASVSGPWNNVDQMVIHRLIREISLQRDLGQEQHKAMVAPCSRVLKNLFPQDHQSEDDPQCSMHNLSEV
jgi:hypothetical protein